MATNQNNNPLISPTTQKNAPLNPMPHHTTPLPKWIGNASITLNINKQEVELDLQFTVFGELLDCYNPLLDLPEQALKLTFDANSLQKIRHEIDYLPYLIPLIAFLNPPKNYLPQGLQTLQQTLQQLSQNKQLTQLPYTPNKAYAQALFAWQKCHPYKIRANLYEIAFRLPSFTSLDSFKHRYYHDFPLIPILTYYLNSNNDYQIRQTVAKILGKLNNPQVIPTLITALKDRNYKVAEYAAKSLIKYENDLFTPILEALKNTPEQQKVNNYRRDADKSRAHLCNILGNLGNIKAVPTLIDILHDKHEAIRIAAATALSKLKCNESICALIKTTNNDKSRKVRMVAVRAICNWHDERSKQALEHCLKDEYFKVRKLAANYLKQWEKS